jgi:four helix bundle protein
MSRDYTKIIAWQRAHQLVLAIYQVTGTFPREELYGIVSQLRRAGYSVASNIVEGSARNTDRDYLHFLNIAQSSLRELEYFLMLSRDLGYLSDEQYQQLSEQTDATARPLHGLIEAVKRNASEKR